VTQTRLGSFIEAGVNTFIGFWVSATANMVILPLYGFTSLTWSSNMELGLIYTGISVIRGYAIRRWFNAKLHAAAERWAKGLTK